MYQEQTKEVNDLKAALEKLGVRVLAGVDDGYKRIDLAIPAARINIEVDGMQHLTDADQIIADLNRSYYSNKNGYNTIHIPNKLIHTNLDEIASALAQAAKIREQQFNLVNYRPAKSTGTRSPLTRFLLVASAIIFVLMFIDTTLSLIAGGNSILGGIMWLVVSGYVFSYELRKIRNEQLDKK